MNDASALAVLFAVVFGVTLAAGRPCIAILARLAVTATSV